MEEANINACPVTCSVNRNSHEEERFRLRPFAEELKKLALAMRGIHADTGHENADWIAARLDQLATSMGEDCYPIDASIMWVVEILEGMTLLRENMRSSS